MVLGTTTAVGSLVDKQGWSAEAVVIAAAGVSMAVGLWWAYFAVPFADLLHQQRERCFRFGFGHVPIFAAVAAIGAGLHVAASFIEGEAKVGETTVVLAIAVPLAAFFAVLLFLYWLCTGSFDGLHAAMLGGAVVVIGAAVAMASYGVGIGWCIAVLMLAPWVFVLAYEWRGHEHIARDLRTRG